MKQIHLNILLPVAMLASLAAAAAVFVIPMPFLGAPDGEQLADINHGDTSTPPPADANLPRIQPEDWTTLIDALEAARITPAGPSLQIETTETPDEPEPPRTGAQSMLNGLQWSYVGNIFEPSRIVACVEKDGKQSWIVVGQTTTATAGLNPFDVSIKAISEKELIIEYENATRTFPIKTTSQQSKDFELAT